MRSSNGPISSLQNGCVQPPNRKPLVGSSSGPPGACMTPSSERKTAPVSLRIDRLAGRRRFDRRDVDLAHGHHGLERALSALAAFGRQLEQTPRRDLPGKAPLVLAPATGALLAAAPRNRVPIAVGFLLVFGQDHEADGFVGFEIGTAVQSDERAAEDGELDRQLVTLLA